LRPRAAAPSLPRDETAAPAATQDPLLWQGLITALFAALVFHGLAIPSQPYFDEIHYVPARALLAGLPANPEHPLLAKEAIALAIRLLGDTPLAWRLPGALMGCAGLLAFGRALWWASGRAVAAVAGCCCWPAISCGMCKAGSPCWIW
jgi:hypothetical protein